VLVQNIPQDNWLLPVQAVTPYLCPPIGCRTFSEEKVHGHPANILYLSCSNNCKVSSCDTLVKKGTILKSIKMSASVAVVISKLCMKLAKFLM
jgi:hypothetical protein